MGDIKSIQMDEEERNEFLTTGGTGVISFPAGTDESPYTLPVSYGYDAAATRFYFRLAFSPDSKKEEVIDRPISFVTYDKTEGGWRSVAVMGRLKEVAEADIDSDIMRGIRHVDIPIVDVFDRHPREVSFRFFYLDPDELTSRKEP